MLLRMIATTLLAFGATYVMVLVLMPVARRLGLVDLPDARKTHSGEVPTIGGIAIAVAVVETAVLMGAVDQVHPAFWAGLLVIVLVGTLDDLRDLGHRSKFLAQITAAALMVFWAGWYLQSLGDLLGHWPLVLGVLSIPFSLFAIIGVVNAINFSDGADGLAGGLAFNALLWLAVIAALGASGTAGDVQIMLAFLGAIAAFLAFNLRLPRRGKALIFLGDAGSLGLGFVLAWLMVWGAARPDPVFAPVTAIWLLAVPLADTLTCAGRRLFNGTSPFKADRKHLHHILVDMGMPIGKAVAAINGCAFILAAIGVAGWYYSVPEHVMFLLAMGIFAAYIVFSAEALRVIDVRRGHAERIAANESQEGVLLQPRNMPFGLGVRPSHDPVAMAELNGMRGKGGGFWAYRNASTRRGKRIERLTNPETPTEKIHKALRGRHRSGRA